MRAEDATQSLSIPGSSGQGSKPRSGSRSPSGSVISAASTLGRQSHSSTSPELSFGSIVFTMKGKDLIKPRMSELTPPSNMLGFATHTPKSSSLAKASSSATNGMPAAEPPSPARRTSARTSPATTPRSLKGKERESSATPTSSPDTPFQRLPSRSADSPGSPTAARSKSQLNGHTSKTDGIWKDRARNPNLPTARAAPRLPRQAAGFTIADNLRPPVSAQVPSMPPPNSTASEQSREESSLDPPVSAEPTQNSLVGPPTGQLEAMNIARSALKDTSPKPAVKPSSWAALLRKPESENGQRQASQQRTAQTNGHLDVSPPLKRRVSIQVPGASEPVLPGISSPPTASTEFSAFGETQTSQLDGPSRPVVAPRLVTLQDKLGSVVTRFDAPAFYPRGLVNTGNLCFANTIFQSLLYCGPFYNLISLLGQETSSDLGGKTPLMEAMIVYLQLFRIMNRQEQDKLSALDASPPEPPTASDGEPFAPEMLYDAMKMNKRFDQMRRGLQEDAQEFLGYFLDTLHEEVLSAIDRHDELLGNRTRQAAQASNAPADDGWLEVGNKGRTATTRSSATRESPITSIFGGRLRSVLRCPGQKDSVTLEPFLQLQLDIEEPGIHTIEDALIGLSQPELLQDFATQQGQVVTASKQLFLEAIPPILVLHLKRFSYTSAGGILKSNKIIGYDLDLDLPSAILAPSLKMQTGIPRYQLTSVVYHHGKSALGGHYTVSVRPPAPFAAKPAGTTAAEVSANEAQQWYHLDDTHIRMVPPAQVAVNREKEILRLSLPSASALGGTIEKSAYLLFYRRPGTTSEHARKGNANAYSWTCFPSLPVRALVRWFDTLCY
ncbi:uncharacterized protein L969DRAFT_44821 [Mixia osmundae IAM 14324]|uniref:ubiquitinyl hydrolase 1 n=1 Tax=Mixia osmundae (strain CBS 9802 / IAM 14324 / JCM 22182 / KY 12970) TaxID=764103 RepID=G7DXZ3_MIXOS|nr:uncharacterized protein L969DRAFT_44821 [Mixia osmundae IAM 14324]KEI41354.1 hypothetical protein L969DRAFT_44821 [Mixia osmundae IAM 14324]GAA95453.1 hypothetical protein E5Q_02107 [Mixia osmundae IAM 14324]